MYARSAHNPVSDEVRLPSLHACVSLDDGNAALLALFSQDVVGAAICTVSLLSCFNSVEYSKGMPLPANLAAFAPIAPRSFALLPGSGLLSVLAPATRSGLKGFLYYLSNTAEELSRVVEIAHAQGGIVYRGDLAQARDAANSAACFAKLALKDLVSIHARVRHEFEVAQMNYLAALIDDVLEGKSPLLSGGRISPVRAEFQIRQRRVELNAEALVADPRRFERHVVVTNISAGGLGFKGASEFVTGQAVEIKLVSSPRQFTGKIVWKLGTEAGVEFFKPLPETDELLKA